VVFGLPPSLLDEKYSLGSLKKASFFSLSSKASYFTSLFYHLWSKDANAIDDMLSSCDSIFFPIYIVQPMMFSFWLLSCCGLSPPYGTSELSNIFFFVLASVSYMQNFVCIFLRTVLGDPLWGASWFSFCCTRVWTRGLVLAGQVLY
jgi:hypothetical protein